MTRSIVAAVVVLVVTVVLAFGFYAAGSLADWSGQHRMPPQAIAASITTLVIGSVIAVAILVRARRSARG